MVILNLYVVISNLLKDNIFNYLHLVFLCLSLQVRTCFVDFYNKFTFRNFVSRYQLFHCSLRKRVVCLFASSLICYTKRAETHFICLLKAPFPMSSFSVIRTQNKKLKVKCDKMALPQG